VWCSFALGAVAEADKQPVNALGLLAGALALVGMDVQAAGVAERALAVAGRVSRRELRAAALCVAAETLATVHRAEQAQTAIAEATNTAREVEDGS
jgi:hypothetical protein